MEPKDETQSRSHYIDVANDNGLYLAESKACTNIVRSLSVMFRAYDFAPLTAIQYNTIQSVYSTVSE